MASKSSIKMCLAVLVLFLIIVTTLIVTLIFTVFKIKQPKIIIHPVGLENFTLPHTLGMNFSVGTMVTIVNQNYGSFKYEDSTGYINFDGHVVAQIPLKANFVPARSSVNMFTVADFMIAKLISDPKFFVDLISGTLNFTSTATLPGKVKALKFIKFRATAYSSCDISFKIASKQVDSKCLYKIKV